MRWDNGEFDLDSSVLFSEVIIWPWRLNFMLQYSGWFFLYTDWDTGPGFEFLHVSVAFIFYLFNLRIYKINFASLL